MLKVYSKINNVSQFIINKGIPTWLLKTGKLYIQESLFKDNVKVINNLEGSSYTFINTDHESVLLRPYDKKEINTNEIIPQFSINDNLFIALAYNADYTAKDIISFNPANSEVELLFKNFQGGIKFFYQNHIFSLQDNAIISAFSTVIKDELWKTGLKDLPGSAIVKVLGVSNEVLWVTSRIGNESHWLIGLNIGTGEIIYSGNDFQIKYAHATELFTDNDRIMSMHGFSRFEPETEYKEFDAGTGKIIRQGVVDSLLKENLVLKDWAKYGDKIYFTAIKEEKFPTHIGVMDYETLNLLYYEKVDTTPGHFLPAGIAPVADGDKLYILDGGGILHIYRIEL